MAEMEQLNYRGTGIGHSWIAGMLPGAKRWMLLLDMQSNHCECLAGWWILHPHTATKNPSLKQERKSKLSPSIHVLQCTCTDPLESVRKGLIARENPVLVCYFPPFGIRAAAPSSAVNQSLIYHPLINVSCCLGLLSRVGICFSTGLSNNPGWSDKGTGILQGEGHLLPLKLLLGSISFQK